MSSCGTSVIVSHLVGYTIFLTDSILGDTDVDIDLESCLNRQFGNMYKNADFTHHNYLKKYYDWETLYYIIQICPGGTEETFTLQDLFNIIDMHLQNNQGFYVPTTIGKKFISSENLIPAKNALKMVITLIHTLDFQNSLLHRKHILNQYESFVEILYHIMVEEGKKFHLEGKKLIDREFYLFSYAIISMNWDPILLWLLFNAHKKFNDEINNESQIDDVKLKMFHDLGHFMGVRQVDGDTPQVWYPFNETVVQRVNDTTKEQSRYVRVGKFYFPHGSTAWRECPNCGKLTMYLGSKWATENSLFPPHLLSIFKFGFIPKSTEEQEAIDSGKTDIIQCAFCGTLTENRHTPIVMQSNFKSNHPSFVEEIQRDMRIAIEKAKHIILMGYTLPTDDVIYRSLLSARKNRDNDKPLICSVIGLADSKQKPDKWMNGLELLDFIHSVEEKNSSFSKAVESAFDIFGIDNVRAYCAGIPSVFINSVTSVASKQKVLDLLYPTFNDVFPNNIINR